MKLSLINSVAGIFSAVKLTRIADKKVKENLLNDYLHLRKFLKDTLDDRKEIVTRFQEDWRDELAAVEALRKEGKPVDGHDAYLEAEKDANKAIEDLFDREIETHIKAVKMEDFMSACGDADITFEQVAILVDAGVIIDA